MTLEIERPNRFMTRKPLHRKIGTIIIRSKTGKMLRSGAIKQKSLIRTAKKAFFENRDNSFLWKHVKDITGQSQANRLPSALKSD